MSTSKDSRADTSGLEANSGGRKGGNDSKPAGTSRIVRWEAVVGAGAALVGGSLYFGDFLQAGKGSAVTQQGDASMVGKKKAGRDADHAQRDLEKVGGDKAGGDVIKAASGGVVAGREGVVIQADRAKLNKVDGDFVQGDKIMGDKTVNHHQNVPASKAKRRQAIEKALKNLRADDPRVEKIKAALENDDLQLAEVLLDRS